MSLRGWGQPGAPLLPAQERGGGEGGPEMRINGFWVTCRMKRFDPEGRQESEVSHPNKEGCLLRGSKGPRFPWSVGLCLYIQTSGAEGKPRSARKPSLLRCCSAQLKWKLRTEAQRWGGGHTPASSPAEASQAVLWNRKRRDRRSCSVTQRCSVALELPTHPVVSSSALGSPSSGPLRSRGWVGIQSNLTLQMRGSG